jgi:MFS family permease
MLTSTIKYLYTNCNFKRKKVLSMKYLTVLQNKNFSYLLIGNFLRSSCFVLFSLQLIWFTIDLTHHSAWKLSLMVMSQTLPFIIFGVLGGAFSDRHNKRKILVLSDFALALIILLIPILAFTSSLNYVTLLIISTIITMINCFTDPAFRALLPELITEEDLATSNALIDSLQRGSNIGLPAFVGVLVFLVGNVGVFYICSALLFLGFIANSLIKNDKHLDVSATNTKEDFKLAWAFLKTVKTIPYIIIIQFICIAINTGLWRVALPLFIAKNLHAGVGVYGLATSFLGVASLIMSLIVGLLTARYIILKFSIGVFIWGIGLFTIAISPNAIFIYLAAVLIGIGQSIEGLTRSIAIQTQTPPHLMGKVFSSSSTSNYAADTLSLGIIGVLTPIVSLGLIFGSGGIIVALLSFIGIKFINSKHT